MNFPNKIIKKCKYLFKNLSELSFLFKNIYVLTFKVILLARNFYKSEPN